MKVLHLTTHLDMGGISIYILRLAKFLKPLGIGTFVFSSGGSLEARLRAEGAALLIKPVRTKNVFHPKLFLQIPFLIRTIRRENIQLIHAHTRVMQGVAFWVSLFTSIPVVTTCHGFYKPKLGRLLLPAWGKKVIAISCLVQEHLEKDMRVPVSKIRMIHNGADIAELTAGFNKLTAAQAKTKYGFAPDQPVIGMIARLVRDKGHEYAIQSLTELSKDYPGIGLLIAGQGPYRDDLERLTRKLGLESRVRFVGTVNDIGECIRAMDLFVFPATWREGFGLSIIEAMACRRPVIVTNIWALSLLVHHRETGLLINPKDATALENAVCLLLKNRELAQQLGEKAHLEVLQHFTMERMAREVAEVYRETAVFKAGSEA